MTETSYDAHAMKRKGLPSDMQQVGVVAKYDILRYIRSKRLIGMLAIESLLLILVAILIGGQPAQPFNVTMSNFAGIASTLVIIGATFFAGDAIVSEFHGRTGYLIFPNPIKRSSLFLGKFLSSSVVMVVVMLVYYGVAIVYSAIISSNLDHLELGFYSMGLAVLYAIAAVGLGMLISSLMKTSTGSLVLTFFMLFLILPSVDGVFTLVKDLAPTPSLTYAGGAISAIMSVPYPPETMELGQAGFTLYMHTPTAGVAIVVMIGWIIATMALAYFLFKRREMSA